MSQTGGGCRASNYIGFIRRALEKAGYDADSGHLDQLERSGGKPGLQDHAGSCDSVSAMQQIFGDIMMKCVYRMRPYEQKKGTTRPDSQEMGEDLY